MNIETAYLERCISTLQKALGLLRKTDPEEIDYDMYRSACIKEFEIIFFTGVLAKLNKKNSRLIRLFIF